MIISQAPLRVSFLGGGTDYPAYFQQHGGATLGTAISQYVYVSVNRLRSDFFDYTIRASYRKTEHVRRPADLEHPAIRACLEHVGIERDVEVNYFADLPARTGLGSSSAFVVALLQALYAFRGRYVSKEQLAHEAIYVERERLGEPVGCQDQMLAAFGGLNYLEFRALDDIRVTPLPMHPERHEALRNRLMMFYTHIRRDTRDVVADQDHRTKANGATLETLRRLAERGRDVLAGDGDLRSFGELLHEGWRQKKRLSSRIAHNAINDLYHRAIAAGAVGGKLLGAGRGGFLLFYVEPEQQATVRQAMGGYPEVNFGFAEQGARVILYQDN